MKFYLRFFAVFIIFAIGFGQMDHHQFDELLNAYVDNGQVDYKKFKTNVGSLNLYIQALESVTAEVYGSWEPNSQKAFWINAYNAVTIQVILDHYPIKPGGFIARARFPKNSIRQIDDVWDSDWVTLVGEKRTLNEIEHEILRKEFKDPKLHFVLVCASIGCPLLENSAYFADDLEQRLEQAAENFINNPHKVRLDKKENILYVSSIFNWFDTDFDVYKYPKTLSGDYNKSELGIVKFILRYINNDDGVHILEKSPEIEFLDYDWSLNERGEGIMRKRVKK